MSHFRLLKGASAGLQLAARPGEFWGWPGPARFFQEISRPSPARARMARAEV